VGHCCPGLLLGLHFAWGHLGPVKGGSAVEAHSTDLTIDARAFPAEDDRKAAFAETPV
jgi:hypothetical protein